MKIIIMNREIEMENNLDAIDRIYSLIEEEISSGNQNFSHLNIDGEDIYEDMEEYLSNNIDSISEIKIITATVKELIENTITTTKEYIERAIPEIESLSDGFYSDPSVENWNSLSDLFGGIGWIVDSFQSIDSLENLKDMVKSYENWNEYAGEVHSLSEILKDLEEALENEDIILVGDLLSYEIVPIMKNMESKLGDLI